MTSTTTTKKRSCEEGEKSEKQVYKVLQTERYFSIRGQTKVKAS